MSTQFEIDWSLFLAARSGDQAKAREKLEAGANPNFVEPTNKNRGSSFRPSSVLLRAVSYGHCGLVELLLDKGAELPVDVEEGRRLSYAARCADNPSMLLLLFRRGLRPTREDADWAQQKGYSDVQEFAEGILGAYEIHYDIDELLNLDVTRFYSELTSILPTYNSIHEELLFPEERVIRDLWEFTIAAGNGFDAMVFTEHYDNTVARAHSALQRVGPSLAAEAVTELWAVMIKCGFPSDSWEGWCNWSFSEATGPIVVAAVEALDRQYFNGAKEFSLWHNLDYLDRGIDFARQNIDTLRKRKEH